MSKLRLLDLFCGAGGAAMGYYHAGFEVVGVDNVVQSHYPFQFCQGDALSFLRDLIVGEGRASIRDFDAIHASPPCQAFSDLQKQNKREYPDLVSATRELLKATGLRYVIENVEGAPLVDPVVLCGIMFPGLRVLRHRLFETNWRLDVPACGAHPLVFTHDKRKRHYGQLDQDTAFIQVTGGGNATVANKRAAMGIDWMTGAELNQAIPPAFTRFVGAQLIDGPVY